MNRPAFPFPEESKDILKAISMTACSILLLILVLCPALTGVKVCRIRTEQPPEPQAVYVLKRLELSVETEVKNAEVTVGRSLQRVKVAERTVDLAGKTLEQEMYRLKEGL